ncbi:autotransporter outer membrane beta-barrel domain-containing protein [Phyllobacterium leguminum]|uniref:autotransporter family protein n=1 Tax=Phyllobacterium leguminum TaxID=314237 RepID=UPI0015E8A041|nr:autotransporter outer membrane beta-barrel domain-containing protein [Phyllobacterium leguminum]
MTKVGTGTLSLTGTNIYTGNTKIEGGAILLGDGGASGSIMGDVALFNGATFGFNRSDTALQFTGLISGDGKVAQMGSGETTLTNMNNSYTDGTFFDAGKLSVSSDGNLGAASGALDFNGGTLKVTGATYTGTNRAINWGAQGGGFEIAEAANTFKVTKDIAGGGPLSLTGPGTLVLTGANSYAGTTINSGTLQIGDGGSTGTLGTGSVLNNSALVFDRDATAPLIVPGAISGTGSVTQQGAGTTILTGNSNYSGGTLISGGALQLGDGGNAGSITGDVTVSKGATLAINRSDDLDFTAAITGEGGVRQIGPGTTIFDTAQDYSGPTLISGGALQVNGALASNVTVAPLGTLSGVGRINNHVSNSGIVEPGTGGLDQALIIAGNYTGNGGTLALHGVLGADNSPMSHLVIAGAGHTAGGNTGIIITNAGGDGDLTTGNGIPVVVAKDGAGITTGSFHLARQVSAGPFEYLLFQGTQKGGGTAEEEQSYYLRNELNDNTPVYSPTVSIHSALTSLGRQQDVTALGTFHERNGDQKLIGPAANRAAWGRTFGQRMDQSFSGTVSAKFDGETYGLQSGFDVMRWAQPSGHQDRVGMFMAYARSSGEVRGFAFGKHDQIAGDATLEGMSGGVYWTHLAPNGWYTDLVVMGTRFEGSGRSVADSSIATKGSGSHIATKGYGITVSIEGGYPIALSDDVKIEPQAQLVYTHTDINRVSDAFSQVDYNTPDAMMGRIGFRLSADSLSSTLLRPYAKANIWQDFTPTDTIYFDHDEAVKSRARATTLEVGGGVVWQFAANMGLWVDAAYTRDVGGDNRKGVRGDAGLRVTW